MGPAERSDGGAGISGAGADEMPTTLKTAAESYLRTRPLSRATRNEYLSTLRKWETWGGGIPIEQLRRKDLREFLDRVYEQAVKDEGENPGRTANKAREYLRAILYWAWEQELIFFPRSRPCPTRPTRTPWGRTIPHPAFVRLARALPLAPGSAAGTESSRPCGASTGGTPSRLPRRAFRDALRRRIRVFSICGQGYPITD